MKNAGSWPDVLNQIEQQGYALTEGCVFFFMRNKLIRAYKIYYQQDVITLDPTNNHWMNSDSVPLEDIVEVRRLTDLYLMQELL